MAEAARAEPAFHAPSVTAVCPGFTDDIVGIGDVVLESGVRLADVEVAFQLLGPAGAPVVAVLGGISATRYAGSTAAERGWWADQVGPGLGLDTKQYQVLCWDYLGGNGRTTGARSAGRAGRAFPDVTTVDQAQLLKALLAKLGIARLYAFVGASYGGMVALQFGAHFPELVEQLVVISAAHRHAPLGVAWRTLQRKLVEQSLAAGDGTEGLALARTLAMATYRTPEEFTQRFGQPTDTHLKDPDRSPVWAYLRARGEAYIEHMHPRAFLCLSRSIDLHHLQPARIQVPTQLVAVQEDQLVPPALIEELAAAIAAPCLTRHLDSLYGHDAFLKEAAFFNDLFTAL